MELQDFTHLYLPAAERNLARYPIYPACTADSTIHRLCQITTSLIQNAQKFNLTSIFDPAEITKKHLIDSILPLAELCSRGYFNPGDNLPFTAADIGTGAGFPCLPMAAVTAEYFPDSQVTFTAVDSTAKKIDHVKQTAQLAGLTNVKTVVGRAEELGKSMQAQSADGKPKRNRNNKKSTSAAKVKSSAADSNSLIQSPANLRESFDLTCARAVSPLPILLELLSPLTKVGGIVAPLKSHAGEEIAAAGESPEKLGLKLREIITYTLDGIDHRELLVYEKVRQTDEKYPRAYTEITKHPLK